MFSRVRRQACCNVFGHVGSNMVRECGQTPKMFGWDGFSGPWVIFSQLPFQIILSCSFYILRLRPCRRPLWQSQASWLLAWRLGNILIGSLACWALLSVFCFAGNYCLLESLLVHWFLDVSFHAVILVFAAASLQPLSCATSDVTNHIFGMHKCNNIQI